MRLILPLRRSLCPLPRICTALTASYSRLIQFAEIMHYTHGQGPVATSSRSATRNRRMPIQDKAKIDVRTALAVFEKVSRLGTKSGDDWIFDQMRANSGFDGYTVTLSNQHATLTVNFHNTFHLDCDSRQDLQSFVEHLERIRDLPENK